MAVAVLSPQDCLSRHHHRHLISSAIKPRRTPNPNPNPNPNTTTNGSSRRRRNSTSPPPSSTVKPQPRAKSPPIIGQFRILKRGEDLSLPEPEVVTLPVKIPVPPTLPVRDGFYAGSAVTSPPPSSLPLPAFFSKRNGLGEAQNQEIAFELRRVLKLN